MNLFYYFYIELLLSSYLKFLILLICVHELITPDCSTQVHSTFHPLQNGEMSISFRAE